MGLVQKPAGVKLFIAVMFQRTFELEKVLSLLTSRYGEIDRYYGPVDFTWSEYYGEEMGSDLLKYYAVFKSPMDRSLLPSIKNYTNDLESRFSVEGKRVVNIDPGYVARDKLALASTKDFYHRLYLGDGIYGEVTLHYRKGCFRYFSWTYPDYKEPEFVRFLEKARAGLVYGIRKGG
ncbi:MAG: DUF4416 family protein [Chitinispirillaceae bacterium]